MAKYTETDIQNARESIQNGLSVRKAAALHRIPYQTLQNRVKGAKSHRQSAEQQQIFSPQLEETLVHWAVVQTQLGQTLTHSHLIHVAEHLLTANGKPRRLGKSWMTAFFARHPEIRALRKKAAAASKRTGGATEEETPVSLPVPDHPALCHMPLPCTVDETGTAKEPGAGPPDEV